VLASARRAAEGGHFQDADRILGEFAAQHPQSAEGAEANFWRALFRADPANTESTIREQLAAFDAYLTGGASRPRYTEAQVLRRMVEVIDSTRALIVAVRASADAREHAKADEVKRISDELEKAVTELERIKRRLTPKPPP
jgi:acyl-CoA reductase-like NAD-dependent aldehyde dehydrogenase